MKSIAMLKNDTFAIWFVSVYFFVYVVFLQCDPTRVTGLVMSLFSPILLCWMIFTILKYGKYDGPKLEKEEFGYLDKGKDELGVF